MHGEGDGGDDEKEGANDNKKVDPEGREATLALHPQLGPYTDVVLGVCAVSLHNLVAMGHLVDGARVEGELGYHLLPLETRDGKDGEPGFFPSAAIVEIPYCRVGPLGLVGRVVGLVKDEAADGVEAGGGEVGLHTVDAEPGSNGDEVIVGGRKVGSARDVVGDKIVLLGVAGGDGAYIGDVEKALYDAVEGLGAIC